MLNENENYMTNGFVKLHRKILKSELWKLNPVYFKLAIHCLLKASGNRYEYFVRETQEYVILERGQFISSFRKLAKELKFSLGNTQEGIKILEKIKFLIHSTRHRKYSIFTIKNYTKYNPNKKDLER